MLSDLPVVILGVCYERERYRRLDLSLQIREQWDILVNWRWAFNRYRLLGYL
jgi:hypothetical protein